MYIRGENLAMNMNDLGGTPNSRRDDHYDYDDDDDDHEDMMAADRKYSVQSPGGGRRHSSRGRVSDWSAGAKSPVY